MKKFPLPVLASSLLFFSLAAVAPQPAQGAPLAITNQTNRDILNILARAPGHEYYFRLDLDPDATDKVENPEGLASIRIDTGLDLYHFDNINLTGLRDMILVDGPALILKQDDGKITQITGRVQPIGPQPGDAPVCNLGTFHPSMPMNDVCAILPGELPRDDNGAILTGMGFAGKTWAARLVPETGSADSPDTRLEHMELRRPLALQAMNGVLDYFFSHDYYPMQAELPGLDMEFDKNADPERLREILSNALARFIENANHQRHSDSKQKCEQAAVIFAPKNLIPVLDAVEEPEKDVEIFTLYLRPCTSTMIVDVAAYRAAS